MGKTWYESARKCRPTKDLGAQSENRRGSAAISLGEGELPLVVSRLNYLLRANEAELLSEQEAIDGLVAVIGLLAKSLISSLQGANLFRTPRRSRGSACSTSCTKREAVSAARVATS